MFVPKRFSRRAAGRRRSLPGAGALLAALVAVQCGACTVGPAYVAPRPTLEPFHSLALDAPQRAVARDLARWWEAFNDPILNGLEQRALAQNLDLAAALARSQQARAAAEAAGAALLPTLDASAQAEVMHQSVESLVGEVARDVPGYRRDVRSYTPGLSASWEIDLAGGLQRGAEASRDEVAAAVAQQAGTRITVAADVADAYFQVRGAQARLAVATDQIDVDSHLLDLVRQRKARGVGNDREVAQAQALLAQAQATVPVLRILMEAQSDRLDVLTGMQPGRSARELADTREAVDRLPSVATTDRPVDVLRRRPDVIAAERRLAASNARIGQALSDYYPKLSLSGLLGFDSLNANQLFTAKAFEPIGTAGLRWRLLDFGKVDAEVRAARGARAEMLAQYRQQVLLAAEDVEIAFTTLAQTRFRTDQLQTEVAALQRSRALSQQSYDAGVIPLTDVLDADRQLLEAQDLLATDRADVARATVGTFRALGGGWTS